MQRWTGTPAADLATRPLVYSWGVSPVFRRALASTGFFPNLFCALALTFGVLACGAPIEEPVKPVSSADEAVTQSPPPDAPPVVFQYKDVRGGTLASSALAGRITVIALAATYDVPSQAQVKFLSQVHRDHAPRINALLIALEQPENEILVQAFADALGLKFPVVMADAATIKGEGPFSNLRHVPSVVILDREGRERTRWLGLMSNVELEEALVKLEAELGPPK